MPYLTKFRLFSTTFFHSFQGGTKGKKLKNQKNQKKVQPNELIGLFVHFPILGAVLFYYLGHVKPVSNFIQLPWNHSSRARNTFTSVSVAWKLCENREIGGKKHYSNDLTESLKLMYI